MQGKPIAQCYFRKGDPSNCLYLTDEYFVVRIKGKSYNYELENLKQLYWSNKVLLLPVIAGGLFTTLSVLAFMNEILHPVMLIILLIGGILLLYYGFIGAPALVVLCGNSEENYLIFKHNIHLQGFTDFVNKYLSEKKNPEYYIFIAEEEWMRINEEGVLRINSKRQLYDTSKTADNEVILKINFQYLPGTITYLPDANNNLAPYVTDNIPLSAITRLG